MKHDISREKDLAEAAELRQQAEAEKEARVRRMIRLGMPPSVIRRAARVGAKVYARIAEQTSVR